MTTHLKVSLRLVAKKTGEAVTFKQDGQRFDQAATVKLNANTEYEFRMTIRPASTVEKLQINGEYYPIQLAGGSDDSDSKIYSAQYSTTGYDVSKNGARKEIVLNLENRAYVKTSIQCKLYKAGETSHSQWGQKLSAIDVDCRMEDGHNFITVLKEKYL